MNKPNEKLKGKRCIFCTRVSNASEGEDTILAQGQLLQAYAEEAGMIVVDQIDEIDITGSIPGKRKKLEQLLARKKNQNDFDVLLIQRSDRFTRSGSEHGFWLSFEFKRAGVKIIFVNDDIPEGRHANVIRTLKYEAAFEQAYSISERSTQGYQRALEAGRCITSSHTPYACYRMYAAPDGKPLHIIRNVRDGRQEKLHFDTRIVIDRYGEVGGGKKGHYRKQQQELVLLMPGDEAEVEVVREIFDLHYRRGLGGKRIAVMLNDRKIPSPRGRKWCQLLVEQIYRQEVYTGRGIGNRVTHALYHERNPVAPKKVVDLDEQVHANAAFIPVRQRPQSEWFFQEQPLMKEFLDPELRLLAIQGQEEMWERLRDPARKKRVVVRRPMSEYLLTGLMYAKQDGEALTGILCGPPDYRTRYYRHRRSAREASNRGVYNRLLPAQAIEDAALQFLREVLAELPDLEAHVTVALEKEIAAAAHGAKEMASLTRRRDAIRKRIRLILSTFGENGLDEATTEVERMSAEAALLDQQIVKSSSGSVLQQVNPKKIARLARERLDGLLQDLDALPREQVRELLAGVVEKVVADLETKDFEIHLALPTWMMRDAAVGQLRPSESLGSSTFSQTQAVFELKIAVGSCSYGRSGRLPCYTCRRKAA